MKKKIIFIELIFLLCLNSAKIFSHNVSINSIDSSLQDLNLISEAEKNGISVFWDPFTNSCLLEKNSHIVSFIAGDSFILQDNKTLVQIQAPIVLNEKLMTNKKFIDAALNFFQTQNIESSYKVGAVLIDPGHGGKDPGANMIHWVNGKKINVVEKDINLKVGLKLKDYLSKAYPDKKILMTRSTDVFLSLNQRTEIANGVKLKDNEAILYVSIHVNSSLDKSVSGYEVWYLRPGYRRQVLKNSTNDKNLNSILNSMMEEEYTTESILIAKFIMDGIAAQVGNQSVSRGIKAEEWFVVRNANMPSVLIETGFLSNQKEGLLLADDGYLQKLSFGIYNGLQAFITHFERSRGFTESK